MKPQLPSTATSFIWLIKGFKPSGNALMHGLGVNDLVWITLRLLILLDLCFNDAPLLTNVITVHAGE